MAFFVFINLKGGLMKSQKKKPRKMGVRLERLTKNILPGGK
jgi:hypothetical protein